MKKINPYKSIQENLELQFKATMGYSDHEFEMLKKGEKNITELESRNICSILEMNRSNFWEKLYKNYNKKK